MTAISQRRWFRFSLRALLALVTVAAILLAWVASERRQSAHELEVAEQLRKQGFREVKLGGPYHSLEVDYRGEPQPWWSDVARRVLGERIFWAWNPTSHEFNDLALLAGLTNLQALQLDMTQVNNLAPLAGHPKLQMLWLTDLPLTDLKPLAGLTNLTHLDLSSTKVRDLAPLAGLSKLKALYLSNAPVTKDQVQTLKKALPKCEIEHDPFPQSP